MSNAVKTKRTIQLLLVPRTNTRLVLR